MDLAKIQRFELGDLSIDPRLRAVRCGDTSASLEPRVMQVLVLLAQHAGEPIDRDQMIEQCWNGVIVGDDAIQRCIGRLRRLASEIGGFSIETIPKIGYRLVQENEGSTSGAPNRTPVAPALPSIGFAPAQFRGEAALGRDLADLLSNDVAAALSLNKDLSVLRQGGGVSAEFSATIELREIGEDLRAHCTLTSEQDAKIVWAETNSLSDPASALASGIPLDEWTVDLASRFASVVLREVTHASLAQDEARAAWQAVVRANAAYQRINLPNLENAIAEARKALELDASYPAGHAALANALAAHYEIGGAQAADEAEEAREHCDIALALAPEDANVLAWVAHALLMITRPAEGLALAEKAVALAPWHPIGNLYLARHYLHHGRPKEAERALERHSEVAPLFPWKYYPLLNRGLVKFMLGDIENAEEFLSQSANLNPQYPYSWLSLMVLGALKSDTELMQKAAERLRSIDGPDSLHLHLARIRHSYPDPGQAEMIANAFRTAWHA